MIQYFQTYFNSIKVRLELRDAANNGLTAYKFQFHKGTIRTPPSLDLTKVLLHFNSIKVRLELAESSLVYS